MKKVFFLIITISIIISCSSSSDNYNNTSDLNIRLSNISPYNFKNIVVNTTTGNTIFENINSLETTNYKTFETAYRYAFVELEIDGKKFTLQPIDYFGETPLENGNYTYVINANNSQKQYEKLSLTLIVE